MNDAIASAYDARPLTGVRVCMLRAYDYAHDGRARKQAAALSEAGAHVTMVGMGNEVPADLAESGYDIRLLPLQLPPLKPPRLGREDVWWPLRVAVNLTYTKALQRQRARYIAKKSSLVYFHEDALAKAAIEAQPDVVHAFNIQTLPAAVRVKKAIGARVVYDCRDLFSDEEHIDDERRARFAAAEASMIHSVDATITVCEPLADILVSRHGIRRPVVVYNGPSEVVDSVSPVHSPVRLLFQGFFRHNLNLSALVEAMCELQGRATLTLQGCGGIEGELLDQVDALGLSGTVRFVEPAPQPAVVQSASTHDVGVICYKGESLNRASAVPNKLMDYLGAGLALAVSDLPGHRSVLDGTGAAVIIDPSSSETIASGLRQLIDKPELILEMKQASLATARKHSWSVQADKLISVYRHILGQMEVARE